MKAVVCNEWGPPDSLCVETKPEPQPNAGEVLVDIMAAGVNFPDTLLLLRARDLGLGYLDTGAMYRAVTYAVLRDKLNPAEHAAVGRLAQTMVLTMANGRVEVDGVDVTDTIRGTEVTSAVSIVAAISEVRQVLREQQREWVRQHGGGVVEGRDIGTVVFPDATLKVYLVATPLVRAKRRVAQHGGDVEEIARAIFTGLMIQYQAVIEQLNADNSIPPAEKVQMLTSMADAFNKAVSASAKVLPETNRLAVAMETVRAFGDYVRERHPARAMDFIDMIQEIGRAHV